MGFNKRYLRTESLKYQYDNGGALAVIDYISKPDALISTDEFSGLFLDLPLKWHEGEPTEYSIKCIDELFWNYEHHWTNGKRNK
tara:strand:- start:14 stop:265 length:252 start_codon:yes stop_codon:yes gene_type:complete